MTRQVLRWDRTPGLKCLIVSAPGTADIAAQAAGYATQYDFSTAVLCELCSDFFTEGNYSTHNIHKFYALYDKCNVAIFIPCAEWVGYLAALALLCESRGPMSKVLWVKNQQPHTHWLLSHHVAMIIGQQGEVPGVLEIINDEYRHGSDVYRAIQLARRNLHV